MNLMRATNGLEVSIICLPENFESLVNEDIVYHEVGHSVKGDPHPYPKKKIDITPDAQYQAKETWYGKN